MREATFMIVISLFERALHWTHVDIFIIPNVTVTARVEYFSLLHYTLYWTSSLKGAVFFLNTVTICGSVFLFLWSFFELPLLINMEMLGIQL